MLSAEQLADYARDGFLVLRELLPAAEVTQLASWADELQATPDRRDYVRKYADESAREDGRVALSRVEYVRPFHAGLRSLFDAERVHEPLRALLGEEAVLFKDKLNYKLPGAEGFALHQDVQAGWRAYARDFVTLMLAIDPMTRENGCLEVTPGMHHDGLLGSEWAPLTAAEVAGHASVLVPASPGDAVLFSGLTPHGSAPNRTHLPRRALLLTYNPRSQGDHYERYFADKRKTFPPDIERDPSLEYRYRV